VQSVQEKPAGLFHDDPIRGLPVKGVGEPVVFEQMELGDVEWGAVFEHHRTTSGSRCRGEPREYEKPFT
jgi:hypothetical protein